MTGVGTRERKYIRDGTDIPHCQNTFNVSLTYCGMLPRDDIRNLVFLTKI